MQPRDAAEVLDMMRVFYASPAVLSNGSEEVFQADIQACVEDSPYLEGYIFEEENTILGYAMAAKSFSTEFGKPCIWLEDLYMKPEYRSQGIGSAYFAYIEQKYPNALLRLEAEEENHRAISLYRRCGYDTLPYVEMKKELPEE
jgi:GNAT superfamily N-acetyltransferase